MCILHHTENHMTLNTNKNLACTYLFGHCVVCLVIVCLSVCHPDIYVCRHSYIHYSHRHAQLKLVKQTLSFTIMYFVCQRPALCLNHSVSPPFFSVMLIVCK